MGRLTGVLGIAAILALAYLFSTDRRAIKLKTVAWGLGLQLALGLFVLRCSGGSGFFRDAGLLREASCSIFRTWVPLLSLVSSAKRILRWD